MRTQRTLLSLIALLLVGADGPDDLPDDTDTDTDTDTSASVSSDTEPMPAELTGGEALAQATRMLALRRWEDALSLSIIGVSKYPEQAESFRTISGLATDQIARGPTFSAPGQPAPSQGATGTGWRSDRPLAVPADGSPPTTEQPTESGDTWRSPRWREPREHPAANDPRKGILVGFDAGLTNGLRVEWKAKGRTIDGVGLQAGLGTWVYSGLYLAPITQIYMDFQSRSDFQFETSLGVLWASGSAYPLIGIGGQWDPPKPIQVNVGVDVGLGVFPDVSVGFLW